MVLRSISALVVEANQALLKKFGPVYPRVVVHWDKIVGVALAKVSMPLKLEGEGGRNVLYITVPGSANAMLVQYSTHLMLEKINLFLGSKAVDQIRVIKS